VPDTVYAEVLLLLCYSMGLGLSMMLAAFGVSKLMKMTAQRESLHFWIERIAGMVLIFAGLSSILLESLMLFVFKGLFS